MKVGRSEFVGRSREEEGQKQSFLALIGSMNYNFGAHRVGKWDCSIGFKGNGIMVDICLPVVTMDGCNEEIGQSQDSSTDGCGRHSCLKLEPVGQQRCLCGAGTHRSHCLPCWLVGSRTRLAHVFAVAN